MMLYGLDWSRAVELRWDQEEKNIYNKSPNDL